jgi:hypothetical protein
MVLMSGWIAADAVDQRYRGEEAAAESRRVVEEQLTAV